MTYVAESCDFEPEQIHGITSITFSMDQIPENVAGSIDQVRKSFE